MYIYLDEPFESNANVITARSNVKLLLIKICCEKTQPHSDIRREPETDSLHKML